MTTGQYRALIAYLSFWPKRLSSFTVEGALADLGLSMTKDEALSDLWKCCWEWDEETKTLTYNDD